MYRIVQIKMQSVLQKKFETLQNKLVLYESLKLIIVFVYLFYNRRADPEP